MLPVNFLRQLIGMYGGGQMQSMVPQYLEASLEAFQRNQSQMRDALAGAFTANPLRRARPPQHGAVPGRRDRRPGAAGAAAAGAPSGGREDELERLRAELADLQAKVEKLTRSVIPAKAGGSTATNCPA